MGHLSFSCRFSPPRIRSEHTRRQELCFYICLSEVKGELVRLVRPPVKPGNRFRFRSFVRAVRAGEAKLCGRVTDAASDAGAGSWEMSSFRGSCGSSNAECAWVLTRFGVYVSLFDLVYMPCAWVL